MLAFDRSDMALIIACTSAIVAVASLMWQVHYALRVDRAVVELRVQTNMALSDQASGAGLPAVSVTATNHGKRATDLTFLALSLKPHTPWHRRVTRSQRGRIQVALLVARLDDPDLPQPTLPKRLDVGGTTQVLFRREYVVRQARAVKAVTLEGFANVASGRIVTKAVPATPV